MKICDAYIEAFGIMRVLLKLGYKTAHFKHAFQDGHFFFILSTSDFRCAFDCGLAEDNEVELTEIYRWFHEDATIAEKMKIAHSGTATQKKVLEYMEVRGRKLAN